MRNGTSPLRVAPPHGRAADPAPVPLKTSLQETGADRHTAVPLPGTAGLAGKPRSSL